MTPREGVLKAEEDFAVTAALARPRNKPLRTPVCIHAQQCVEKFWKARFNETWVRRSLKAMGETRRDYRAMK